MKKYQYQYQYQYQFAIRAIVFFVIGMIIATPTFAATICGYNDTDGKLAGVGGACRTTALDGEYNSFETRYFFDKGINFSCPSQSCMVRQGAGLCAAVAKLDGLTDKYTCLDSSVCGTPLSNGQVGGSLCPSSQLCCTLKASSQVSSGSSGSGPSSLEVPDPLGGVTIPGLIGNVIKTFAGIAGSLALVIFVIGGFQYILSGGEPAKVKGATMMLRNGAIGIVLIFGAYFFTSTIINLILVKTG